jgi:hypothetical protein
VPSKLRLSRGRPATAKNTFRDLPCADMQGVRQCILALPR